MNYILFDDASRNDLLPLTFVRPVADIRIGILTIREKWEKMLNAQTSTMTDKYLSGKYPLIKAETNILINGSVCPNAELIKEIHALKPDESLVHGDYIIAMHMVEKNIPDSDVLEGTVADESEGMTEVTSNVPHLKINNPWDIFCLNGEALKADFELLTRGRKSQKISDTNRVSGAENIFIEEGATVEFAMINAQTGPVYIGKNALVMEGAMLRGPVAVCEGATVKMGAKIYGPTTIGPWCKIGGELNNVVLFANSNKAHDGFIGHSVIAEWCNFGADTNNSNLKNTYDEVKLWSYPQEKFIPTGQQFCGLIMGDHSKCGINTMFNTGTVVGVFANIFGHGYQRNFIPSFSWGTSTIGYTTYDVKKALEVANLVMARRNQQLGPQDAEILKNVYEYTFTYRKKRV